MVPLSALILRTFSALWLFTVLSGAFVYWSIEQNNRTVTLIQEQQEEITQIHVILNSVLDLETGLRGYLLTGDLSFLAPHEAARKRLPEEFRRLERLFVQHDERAALEPVTRAEQLVELWYARAATPQIEARVKNPERVAGMVQSQVGKKLTDAIRMELEAAETLLTRELELMHARNQASLRRLQIMTPLGVLFALAVSVVVGSRLASHVAQTFARLRDATRALAAGDLSTRAPNTNLLESRQLAADFNDLAAKLEASEQEVRARSEVLRRRHGEVSRIAELSDALQSCHSTDEGYRVLRQVLPLLFPEWSGTFSTLNPSKNLLELRSHWGDAMSDTSWTLIEPEACWALRRGHTYVPTGLGLMCAHHEGRANAYVCIPLLAQHEALGVLQIIAPAGVAEIPADVREYAESVAQQVALAIGNLRLRESLRQQSLRDPMTGLHNRRYLDETLERELRRAQRANAPLSVLAVDVDHFKHFNDTYGHEAGDVVLTAVAHTMRDFFRLEDIVCRYGGEEFLVVLLSAGHADAVARADVLRERIAALNVRHEQQSLGRVTVSIGVATYPADGATGQVLIGEADQALYRAKREGRNCVASAAPSEAAPSTETGRSEPPRTT